VDPRRGIWQVLADLEVRPGLALARCGRLWPAATGFGLAAAGCGAAEPGCGAAGPGQVRPDLHLCFGASLWGSFVHYYSHIYVPTSKNTNKARGTSLVFKICMKFVISSSHSWDNDGQTFVVRTVNSRASFSIFCSGPQSFLPSRFGPWPIWSHVHFLSWLMRASLSSQKVLDELYPEVLLLALKSCINNKLQKQHTRANLLYQGG
jgi:hypothetical protein